MYCVKCGNLLLPEARFCTSCGTAAEKNAPSSTKDITKVFVNSKAADGEDDIYAVIAAEMKSGNLDAGLWTRLFAEFDGNESKTKVAYIKKRAEKLDALEQARTQEEARQRREEIENAAAKEKTRRAAESESERLKLVAEGHLTYATLDECLALLEKAGYTVDRNHLPWVVRSIGKLGSSTEVKDHPEFRLYVEKVTFARATKDDCISEFKKLGCGVLLKTNGLTTVTLPNGERRVLEGVGEFRNLAKKLNAGTLT